MDHGGDTLCIAETRGLSVRSPKLPALQQEPEVADCQLRCQQFSVKGGVFDLGWRQFFGEKGQGGPTTSLLLLQHPPYMGVGVIHC